MVDCAININKQAEEYEGYRYSLQTADMITMVKYKTRLHLQCSSGIERGGYDDEDEDEDN